MNRLLILLYSTLVCLGATAAHTGDGIIAGRDITFTPAGDELIVDMNLVLDQLTLGRNRQVFVTPYIENGQGTESIKLPTYVFSGRNMHYLYLRNGQTKATGKTRYDIAREIYVPKGQTETVAYTQRVDLQPWMLQDDAVMRLSFDTCGCGRALGESALTQPLALNPLDRMLILPYPRPVAEVPKIQHHNGKARVDFEVDKFELHEQVYSYTHKVTKRKHTIDNRKELQTICDSIAYATSNPDVEIVGIQICGYASPESPYDHNDYLATNRSRALSEWVAKRYNLPQDRCTYDAVPENWKGFRQQTLDAKDITEEQRQQLLELIDRPAYGPTDWDGKETELKTSPKFAKLYSGKIHPDWFPELRYTDFSIQTQLKPMTNEQLHQIIRTSPELMSLNQIFTVASECEHDSEEFRYAMQMAVKYYPEDEMANTTAAAMAIEAKDYALAEKYLQKAGDNDDANVLRGIVATWKGDFKQARQFFRLSKSPQAQTNLQLIGNR